VAMVVVHIQQDHVVPIKLVKIFIKNIFLMKYKQAHCCPSGYSCDDSGNRCIRHFNSFNETDRIPSALKLKSNEMKNLIPYSSNEDELCPDGKSRCSLNSTCCPNKATNPISYSCCPYSKVNFF
jgi:hypothetical protein